MQELPVILIAARRRLEISFGSCGHFVTSNRAGGEKFERNVVGRQRAGAGGEDEEVEGGGEKRENASLKIKEPSSSARERGKRLRRTSGYNCANIYMR